MEGAIKWRDANVVVKRQRRRLNPLAAEFFIPKPVASATETEVINAADGSISSVGDRVLTSFNPYSKEFYHANRPMPLHADGIAYYGEFGNFYMDEGDNEEMEVKKRRRSKKRSKRKKKVPDLENDPDSYVSRLKFGGSGKLEKEQNMAAAATAENQKNAATSETPIIQSAQNEITEQVQMKNQEKPKLKPGDGVTQQQQTHSTRGTKKTLWVDALKDGVKLVARSNTPVPIQKDGKLQATTAKKVTHKGLIHSRNNHLSMDNERSQLTRNVKTNSGFMMGSLIATEIERQLRSQKKKREKKASDAKIDYRKIPLPPKKRKSRTLIIPIGRDGKRTVNIDLNRFTPGMYREMSKRKRKKKRPSTLKKIILAEKKRNQQEQHERAEEQRRKLEAEQDNDTGWETVDEFEQDDILLLGDMACVFSSESPARNDETRKGKTQSVQRSQSNDAHIADDNDMPLNNKNKEFEEVSEYNDGNNMKPKSEPPKRVVREYVDQLLNKKLDELVTQFIYKLRYYQAKIRVEQPLMFEMKRKFVVGLKQTIRSVKYGKAVAVIIAPNIESIKSEGGLDDLVYTLIEAAQNKDVPIVYALKVKRLGHIFGKHQMSCMAIYRTDPAHAEFKSIMNMVAENRKLFHEQNPHWEEEVYLNHPAVRKLRQQRDQSVKQKEIELKSQRHHDRAKHRKFLERAKREKMTKPTGSSSSSDNNNNNKTQQVASIPEKNKQKQQQQQEQRRQKKQGKQARQHENDEDPNRPKQNPAQERSSSTSRRTSGGNPRRGKRG